MNKYYFFVVLGLLFIGCSVDNDEMNLNDNLLNSANSVLEIDGCESISYDLYSGANSLVGEFEITNDEDNLYLNFLSKEGFSINEIRWEVALNEDGLPINNGGIIVGQLDHKIKFDIGKSSHGESVSFSEFDESPASLFVAARVKYTNTLDETFTIWVGNESAGKNGSKFLEYVTCDPQSTPVCNADAGSDNSRTYTDSEIDEMIDDLGAIEPLFKTLLDEGISHNGTFKPTGPELLRLYNRNHFQDFKTIYTIRDEENDCEDSAELIITITPDPQSIPVCNADAGSDNSRTYTDSEIDEMIDDLGAIEPLFKTLLDEGISHNGTFKPTGPELLRLYNRNHFQDFKTIYTIRDEENDCEDSAELIITITPDPQSIPVCNADAGSDNSRTYTDSEIDEMIDDLGAIEPLFKTLLDEGISHNGTFKPTGPELLRLYNRNHFQDFKTIYTIRDEENDCEDSAELIITIIP